MSFGNLVRRVMYTFCPPNLFYLIEMYPESSQLWTAILYCSLLIKIDSWACGTHFKQERILFVVCNVMANALETDCSDIKLLSTHLCSAAQTANVCLDDCFSWRGTNCHGFHFFLFLFGILLLFKKRSDLNINTVTKLNPFSRHF